MMLLELVLFNSCSLKCNLYLSGITLWLTNKKIKKSGLGKILLKLDSQEVLFKILQ